MEQNANAANAGMPSVSDAIEKIMAHPELISMVASVLGAPTAGAKESDSIDDSQGQEVAVADAKAESTEAVNIWLWFRPYRFQRYRFSSSLQVRPYRYE